MKCPDRKKEMKMLLCETNYHPVGATGMGTWYFRNFDLYKCENCGEHFCTEKELVAARSIKT